MHMRNASFLIVRIGSTDDKAEKKYASIPYPMTGRMNVWYKEKKSRLLAPPGGTFKHLEEVKLFQTFAVDIVYV